MKYLPLMALRSAWNRRLTFGLIALTIALSVTMLLGVERIRNDARTSFSQSVSGADLVIGARTSPVQLLLYSVFRMGEATSNMSWQSVEEISKHPSIAWVIPLSLGDSHHGFPVLASTSSYFEHYRYGDDLPLELAKGKPFKQLFEAVLGAEVATHLGYKVGDKIALNHGMQESSLTSHADKPFVVIGILKATGTPVDRTVHISLEAMEAIHVDWLAGGRVPGFNVPVEMVRKFDLEPKSVTALIVGLKNRISVFRVQRYVNDYKDEALLAVLPGVALEQLWQVISVFERTLLLVSAMVVIIGLTGLVAVILAGLNERRRELAILRSVGAQPSAIFMMLVMEGLALTVAGVLSGLFFLYGLTALFAPYVQAQYGLSIGTTFLSAGEIPFILAVVVVGLIASMLPGYRAYRLSLIDGLTPRT